MKNKGKLLNKKDTSRAAWRNIFFMQATQNFERMMGLAFCHIMVPIVDKLYKHDEKEHQKALQRHMQFYNTESQFAAVIPGIIIAMEEARAAGEEVSEELIISTKNALMGPFAGIGDSLLIGTYQPILLSIAMSLCLADGNPVGPLFFCIVWLVSVLAWQLFTFRKGYELGIDAANSFFNNKALTEKLTTGMNILGLIVIGGVASTTVKAMLIYKFINGKMEIALQEQIFDKIMPSLLPLIITLVAWYLMDKKNYSALKIIFIIVIFAAVMVATKIM